MPRKKTTKTAKKKAVKKAVEKEEVKAPEPVPEAPKEKRPRYYVQHPNRKDKWRLPIPK